MESENLLSQAFLIILIKRCTQHFFNLSLSATRSVPVLPRSSLAHSTSTICKFARKFALLCLFPARLEASTYLVTMSRPKNLRALISSLALLHAFSPLLHEKSSYCANVQVPFMYSKPSFATGDQHRIRFLYNFKPILNNSVKKRVSLLLFKHQLILLKLLFIPLCIVGKRKLTSRPVRWL